MKKKLLCMSGVLVVVVIAVIVGIKVFSMKQKELLVLPFVDEEMKNTLINATVQCEIIEKKADFRLECLDQIEWLNIGYTGYYTTLEDVKLCKNLYALHIGMPKASLGDHYYNNWYMKPKQESREKISQIENELADILQSCTQLRALYIHNDEGTCELKSVDFLEYGGNLTSLWLWRQRDLDYSLIYNCTNLHILDLSASDISDLEGISALKELKMLDLRYTNISEAGEIVNLHNLEHLWL